MPFIFQEYNKTSGSYEYYNWKLCQIVSDKTKPRIPKMPLKYDGYTTQANIAFIKT